jgi:hypothetical protein
MGWGSFFFRGHGCSYKKNKFPVRIENPLMINLVNVDGENNVQDKRTKCTSLKQ